MAYKKLINIDQLTDKLTPGDQFFVAKIVVVVVTTNSDEV